MSGSRGLPDVGRPRDTVVWVAVARHPHEQGERSEVVAAFSRLTDAVAWMGASPVSLLLVPLVLDAELDAGTDVALDAKKGEA